MRRINDWFRVCLLGGLLGLGPLARAQMPSGAASDETEVAIHDAVVVVLDASGSMRESMGGSAQTRMEAAKLALESVLAGLAPSTHVGVLVFSGTRHRGDWVVPLGPVDVAEVKKRLGPIRPSGGTPLGSYMKLGADRLLQERQLQFGYGSYRLLVVTDGKAGDPRNVEMHTPDLLSRGITLDVIGVDMERDHMLASVAHSYRRANDPASLAKAVSEVFAEIGGVGDETAEPAQEAFELLAGIEPEVGLAMIAALARSGNHPIGAMPPVAKVNPEVGRAPAPQSATAAVESAHSGEPSGCGCQQASLAAAPWFFAVLGWQLRNLVRTRRRRA